MKEEINIGDEYFIFEVRKGHFYINEYFPNKPLHLYTEQENKDLLKKLK